MQLHTEIVFPKPHKNVLNKLKKLSETGQDQKTLTSASGYCYWQSFIAEMETGNIPQI